MNARKYLPNYSYKDYEQWEGRWELIDGIPYAMSPAPNARHQRISARLARYFDEALDMCKPCKVYMPIDYRIDENTVVQPDLSIVCEDWEGQYLQVPPALVVEILSGSTAHKDRNLKYELYEQQQVGYYLIVNPLDETIDIYRYNDGYELAATMDKTQTEFHFEIPDCSFSIDFSKIW